MPSTNTPDSSQQDVPPGKPGKPEELGDRARRENAIRELARSQASAIAPDASARLEVKSSLPRAMPAMRLSATTRGRCIALISGALVLALAIGAAVKLVSFAPHVTPAPKAVITISFGQDAIQCVQGLAWSPDSHSLALLGYAVSADGCPSDAPGSFSYTAGEIAVYDAQSGRLLARYQPDAVIQRALRLSPPSAVQRAQSGSDVSAQVISYEGIAWSATGGELALPFHIRDIVASADPQGYAMRRICGLLLLPLNQSAQTVLSRTMPIGQHCSGAWDIRTGQYLPQTDPTPEAAVAWGISPGLGIAASAYHWNGSDLTPESALPTGGASASLPPAQITPVGGPNDQSSFTIWQPGTLESRTEYFPSGSHLPAEAIPGAQTYSTSFIAWSPDGRYLRVASMYRWLVRSASVAAPTAKSLQELDLSTAPNLSVRDQALDMLMKRIAPTSASAAGSFTLSWRPDGHYLAAISPAGGGGASQLLPSQYKVTLYDTTSGNSKLTLTPPTTIAGAAIAGTNTTALMWSADGRRLAYLDPDLATLIVWEPSSLAALATPAR